MRALILAAASCALAAGAVYQRAELPSPMTDSIAAIARQFKGVIGVAAVNLRTREEIAVNADTRFPTASTIKVAVMVEAYRQAEAGTLPFHTSMILRDAEKVGGSGVLRQMHEGLALTVADLVHLMIVLSDNTATNMLVDRLGTAKVDATLDTYGLSEMRLFRATFRDGRPDVMPELEREFGLGMSTPRAMASLMALIAERKVVSPAASDAMLATLRRQQDRAMIPRLLPSDGSVEVGNKTGTDSEKLSGPNGKRGSVRADAAIVTGPDLHYVIAIYTRQVEDDRDTIENDALVTGARVSRMVYDHFSRR